MGFEITTWHSDGSQGDIQSRLRFAGHRCHTNITLERQKVHFRSQDSIFIFIFKRAPPMNATFSIPRFWQLHPSYSHTIMEAKPSLGFRCYYIKREQRGPTTIWYLVAEERFNQTQRSPQRSAAGLLPLCPKRCCCSTWSAQLQHPQRCPCPVRPQSEDPKLQRWAWELYWQFCHSRLS